MCADCQERTSRLEWPAEVARHVIYGLVYGGSPGSRQNILRFLREESQHKHHTIIRWKLIYQVVCALCFAKHQPHLRTEVSPQRPELIGHLGVELEKHWKAQGPGDRREPAVMLLEWVDLSPIRKGICYCNGFNVSCNNAPHVIRIENVPVESELVAWVTVRGGRRRSMPMYVLDETT
ncbi:hypothetical protein BGX38DRAFT_1226434 [Terfezia claveryi]|nr:hypothetical protein BGX38DRAFT_1226434 [Terfezia claveryi]